MEDLSGERVYGLLLRCQKCIDRGAVGRSESAVIVSDGVFGLPGVEYRCAEALCRGMNDRGVVRGEGKSLSECSFEICDVAWIVVWAADGPENVAEEVVLLGRYGRLLCDYGRDRDDSDGHCTGVSRALKTFSEEFVDC